MPSEKENLAAVILSTVEERGPISYHDYIELCLYHPTLGYYRRATPRVGRGPATDFYTNTAFKETFAPLILAAAKHVFGKEEGQWESIIEIGPEPGDGIFRDRDQERFRTIRLEDPFHLEGEPALVIANEWLDARPFHRLVYSGGGWRELGIGAEAGELREVALAEFSPEIPDWLDALPEPAPDGYRIDLPTGAESALKQLLDQPWTGGFLTFDYGTTWPALIRDFPEGTARTYHRHRQGGDLLETPGQRDITCHLCWDRLTRILDSYGCSGTTVQRQEDFFMTHAGTLLSEWFSQPDFAAKRGILRELLHPAYLGTRFQVLHARKW